MSDNSGLFRKKALEHISSPEQLDTLLEVLPRRSWLPLLVLGLAICGVLVWSVVGQIPIDVEAEGFHARVVQHECDHLDGILYPKRLTDLSKLSYVQEWDSLSRKPAEETVA